jgi:acetyl-CoA C-acetyltransferase
MSKVYLVSAKRTAIGSHLGSLKNVSAPEMAAVCIKAIIEETKIDPVNLDEVIIGNILPAGQKQGVGRQSSLKGGVPVTVPAYSINIACGSGMKAVMLASNSIKAGFAEMILAGGTETMSQSPYLVSYNVRSGVRMGAMNMEDHMLLDALWDAFDGSHMGVTAENIVTKYGFTRQEQDEFAFASQNKAIAAIDGGKFKDEIVPLEVKIGRDVVIFDTDEYPNRKATLEKLATLRPAFKKDGSVTAGNASGINDGASVMLIASEDAVKKYNLTPMAEIVSFGQGGVEPSIMGLGPTPAIRMALKNAELKLSDIDLFELNEAFAAQSLGVIKEISEEHGVSKEEILSKCNVNGGAIALGHPVGASGNRIMTTLVYEMKKRDVTYGLASLCIGGGMGTAIILKNVNR